MNCFTCVAMALLVVSPALGLNMEVNMHSSLTFDAEAAKKRPVTKVIKLLKDMLAQMEKEGEEDEKVYDTMKCWCLTNDKEKTKSIATAKARVSDQTTKIEGFTATSARLTTEIADLNSEAAADQSALDTATAIRQKELKEFATEEKDLLGSIASLTSSITTMQKHNSLLQISSGVGAGVDAVAMSLQKVMAKHSSLLTGVLTHADRRKVMAFVQAPSYAPASGEIFGILSQMQETFQTNLATSQATEGTNQKTFEALKTAKTDEIQTGTDMSDSKAQLLATTDEKNALAKQDVISTKSTLSADEDFLANLKTKCKNTDSEWEERQKTRALETEACSKAMAFLSSDEARDLVSRTLNFVQTESTMQSERRSQASKLLAAAADKAESPELAMLAQRVRLDAFTKVKKNIDTMVAALAKQSADEIKEKDFCDDEFNKNQLQMEEKKRAKTDAVSSSSDLTASIKALTSAIAGLKGEIAEMQKQLKNAGEDREKENKDFQMTVADQRATQRLLATALNILKGFYSKKAAAALMQDEDIKPAGPAPPAGFDKQRNSAASGGVMGLIGQIITDAKAMEAEAIKDESDSQKAYADLVTKTNASIDKKNADVVNKQEDKATKDGSLVSSNSKESNVELELEQLANANAALHSSCDYLVKNFDLRQSARGEEISALKQAKAILSGSKFSAFLQRLD